MASNRPIFVVGCPRSGTTLLALMLHSHSRIAIPPETRFLLDVYRERDRFGDLTKRRNRRVLALAIVRRRGSKFRHLGLRRREVQRAIVAGPPTVGSALGTVYRAYAARFGKERWGDKMPTYFRNIDTIRTLFPDAQFVHLVRDGRDCVASLKRMDWWEQGPLDAMALWTHAIDCCRRASRKLPADTFYEVRYERLVADPRRELESLCDFLGEQFEESMLTPQVAAGELPPRQREGWHANTQNEVTTARVGGYVDGLTPAELRLMEMVDGGRLRRLGYDVPEGRRAPGPVLLARYGFKIWWLRVRTRVLARRDRRLARDGGPWADMGPA